MSSVHFADRTDAGQRLVGKLPRYVRSADPLVLALPRGGVPVAYEIARALNAPLDVLIVRPLRVPGHPDQRFGAVAGGGMRVLHPDVIERAHLTPQAIDAVCAVELAEVMRRERECRGSTLTPSVRRRTVIVVQDGLSQPPMPLALSVLRKHRPARLVAVVPIVVRAASHALWERADEVISLATVDTPEELAGCFESDGEVPDDEIRDLILRAARHLPRPSHP